MHTEPNVNIHTVPQGRQYTHSTPCVDVSYMADKFVGDRIRYSLSHTADKFVGEYGRQVRGRSHPTLSLSIHV